MIDLDSIKRDLRAAQTFLRRVVETCESSDIAGGSEAAEACALVDDALGILMAAEDIFGGKRSRE
jgi:hypothetical protein